MSPTCPAVRSELPGTAEERPSAGRDAAPMSLTAPLPTAPLLAVTASASRRRCAVVEVVVPVHDEEADLEASIRRLHGYLSTSFPLAWLITIADNASTDQTWGIACRLATQLDGVQALHLGDKGR